jgi:K+-sensing histidine kinase KdpD
MSQVASPVQSGFPPDALGSTDESCRRDRRTRSARRRSADQGRLLEYRAAPLTDGAEARAAADTTLAKRDRMIAIFAHDLRGLFNALTINTELFPRQEGEKALKSAHISNLLSNAIKFSSAKGQIVIQATTIGHDVQVAVRDEGPGIPEGDLDRVLESFCQLPDSDARGLGLGLYISRAIIQAHGGRIWATSPPGAGATFHFTVPRSDSEPAPWGSRIGAPADATT